MVARVDYRRPRDRTMRDALPTVQKPSKHILSLRPRRPGGVRRPQTGNGARVSGLTVSDRSEIRVAVPAYDDVLWSRCGNLSRSRRGRGTLEDGPIRHRLLNTRNSNESVPS